MRCPKFRNYDVSPGTKHKRGVQSRVKKLSLPRDQNSIFFLKVDPIPFLGLDLIDPRSSSNQLWTPSGIDQSNNITKTLSDVFFSVLWKYNEDWQSVGERHFHPLAICLMMRIWWAQLTIWSPHVLAASAAIYLIPWASFQIFLEATSKYDSD